ncbi:MAG: PDZ domain-containing protein [Holophaga sp.]|nr:PDZ domain-containing protein [Holophaga sp.]
MSTARSLLTAFLVFSLGGPGLHAQRRRGEAVPADPQTQATNASQGQPAMGLVLKEEAGRFKVVSVVPGSPAETARVQPGDVIVGVGGGTVNDLRHLQRLVAISHLRGLKISLELERAGRLLTVQVGSGLMAGPMAGASATAPKVVAPAPGQGFNLLRYAAPDPRTGEVVCWGDYDPTYPTGPLPYEALLAEALRNPAPSFSLEPTPAGRQAGRDLDQRVAADALRLGRDPAYVQTYAQRLLQVVGTDLAQRPDGQRFAKRCGAVFGLTPAEAMDVLQPERAQKTRGEAGVMALMAKALKNLGTPGTSEALTRMLGGDTWGAVDLLGVGTEVRRLKDEVNSGRMPKEQGSLLMQGQIWGAFLVNAGVNPATVNSERNRRGPAGFLPWAQERFTTWMADKVGKGMFHGLVVGEEALHRLYPGLPSLQLEPICLDGLDPKSALAQTFMRADVALKSILALPDVADRIPGHRSQAEYHQAFLAQHGKGGSGGGLRARTWLQPGAVELRVDPQGTLVQFGEARIGIRSQMLEGGAASLQQEGLNAYAAEISSRYEAYAKVEPELHRLREAAKVLALARWVRAKGVVLRPSFGNSETALGMVPKGFVQATFLMEGDRLYLQPAAVGGVDFSPQVGEAWVQVQPQAGVVPSALGQLQASAALAGQAADAALAGDLTGARELAQRSADAMTGRLQGGLVPGLPMPTAAEAFPMAQASTGLLGRVQTATVRLQKAAPGTPEAEEARVELQGLRVQSQQLVAKPRMASQVVAILRAPGPLPLAPIASAPEPTPAPVPAKAAPMSAEDRRRLLEETTALRSELCRIRAQFRKLNANIQADQTQRQSWEQEVDDAYNRAWERLTKDIMVDAFSGVLTSRWNQVVGKGLRTPEERAKLAKATQLLKYMEVAKNYQDFAEWANLESVDAKYIREGLTQVFGLVDGEEVTRKMLVRWLKRPIPKGATEYYDAAKAVVDTAFDLTAEGFAWARMRQLNRNSDEFLKAVKALAGRQTRVLEGIHAREKKLGLPEGATKDGCEAP